MKILTIIMLTLLWSLSSCGQSKERKQDSDIDSFMNRPIHKHLTDQIIDSIPDDDLLLVVFDNLCAKIPKDYTKEYGTILTFSKPQQAIYLIWGLEAEVNNGGFNQYYYNSTRQFAALLPNAFKSVGAKQFSKLVAEANKVYLDNFDDITKEQDGNLEGFSKSYEDNPLEEFDKRFYALYEKENLQKLQVDFIRRNKKDFID